MSATTENVSAPTFFKGTYEFGLDDKRRVQIPAKWRPTEVGGMFSVILWRAANQVNPCLMVLPESSARQMNARLAATPWGDPNAESLRRLLGADGEDLELDSAGRICLPENLVKDAHLGKKVKLVGMVDCFQIWHPDHLLVTRSADEVARPAAMKYI